MPGRLEGKVAVITGYVEKTDSFENDITSFSVLALVLVSD
jgi:hypothetical protein